MALDLDQLVELAKRRLYAGLPAGNPWADADIEITANVTTAANLAATRIMRDPQIRARLQQTYSITLTAGVGDLSTANGSITGVPNELLMEGIDYGSVVDQDGYPVFPIPHYQDFISPQATIFDYYHITNQKQILTRARNNGQVYIVADIVGIVGPLSLKASYVPASITNWPTECENDLVNALVEITLQKFPGGSPATT